MDDILSDLENPGVGCSWRNHFVGALCYTDDLVLLAPSASALRPSACGQGCVGASAPPPHLVPDLSKF